MTKTAVCALAAALFAGSVAAVQDGEIWDDTVELDVWYVGAAGMVTLPQGGDGRLGGAAMRFGHCLNEFWALEGEVAWLENRAGGALGVLWHWWGYERLDPFFTFGVRGIGGVDEGPKAGLGAFYNLTETLSLRFDADAMLGLEGDASVTYSLSAGLQFSF